MSFFSPFYYNVQVTLKEPLGHAYLSVSSFSKGVNNKYGKETLEGKEQHRFICICDLMDCSHQAPLSMGFSRQEYWSGLPFPSPGDISDPGIKSVSPALQADSLPLCHQGSTSTWLLLSNTTMPVSLK